MPHTCFQRFIILGIFLFALTMMVGADTVSWWRFEAGSDTDTSSDGLNVANEIAGGSAMISDNAQIGTSVPDLFDDFVPQVEVPNTGSILSVDNGNGDDGIFGTAAYDSELDSDSITVEFWARTTESTAGFVARTSQPGDAAEDLNIDDLNNGFSIYDPDDVSVRLVTIRDNNNTNSIRRFEFNSGISMNDGEWHYIAFRYDADAERVFITVDDETIEFNAGGPGGNRPIYWDGGADPSVYIGYQMDGNPNNNTGTLDEIRFSNTFIPDEELLITPIPEPGTIVAALGLIGLGVGHFVRRKRK